jgi:hypothetical protein
MKKANDHLHNYFKQLIEINDLDALIKLNLNYISLAPTRMQEVMAENKNLFSDFFKFAKLENK